MSNSQAPPTDTAPSNHDAPSPAHDAPPPAGGSTEIVEGVGEASLEQLEAQLHAMEEEEGKLAAQFEQANESQRLEPHLAVIEEQFRQSFDDRYSAAPRGGGRPVSFISRLDTGDLDIMKLNSVFRDVSRDLGDDWKPVFTDLMAHQPPEVLAEEVGKIEQMLPIIRGYRALNVWKECVGPDFNIRDLIDALRKNKLDDVADSALTIIEGTGQDGSAATKAKPVTRRKSDVASRSKSASLDNRRMLLLAKKIGGDWEALGRALGLPEEELGEIKEGAEGSTYQGAFKVLWAWRQTQPEIEQASSVEALKAALIQANKQTLAEQLGN